MSADRTPLNLELVINWARYGREWDKVYRFLFVHPEDLFTIPNGRRWSLAHQIIYHGNVELFKRILALYSEDQIDIRTLSNDKKSLLDVAKERCDIYPEMYTFMKRLFLQDDLIRAAKDNNWDLVDEILEDDNSLANEKPPYSTYFLLHYLVQNATKDTLEHFVGRFQFQTNVLSAHNTTPIDLANDSDKQKICDILQLVQKEQLQSNMDTFESSQTPSLINSSSTNQSSSPSRNLFLPTSPEPTSVSSICPYPANDPFPSPDFNSFTLRLNNNGNFILSPPTPFGLVHMELPAYDQQIPPTKVNDTSRNSDFKEVNTKVRDQLDINTESILGTPVTSASKEQLVKNLTCPLTRQMFIDPVIASDGHTYERKAITEWLKINRCSPTTGILMTTSFIDNRSIKQIIQSMKTLRK